MPCTLMLRTGRGANFKDSANLLQIRLTSDPVSSNIGNFCLFLISIEATTNCRDPLAFSRSTNTGSGGLGSFTATTFFVRLLFTFNVAGVVLTLPVSGVFISLTTEFVVLFCCLYLFATFIDNLLLALLFANGKKALRVSCFLIILHGSSVVWVPVFIRFLNCFLNFHSDSLCFHRSFVYCLVGFQ